jgi:hypothetical protein
MASGAGLGGNYRANGVEVKPVVRVERERLTFERRKIAPGLQQDRPLQTRGPATKRAGDRAGTSFVDNEWRKSRHPAGPSAGVGKIDRVFKRRAVERMTGRSKVREETGTAAAVDGWLSCTRLCRSPTQLKAHHQLFEQCSAHRVRQSKESMSMAIAQCCGPRRSQR